MNYHYQWLIEKHQRQEPLQYLFFRGHRPEKKGRVTKSCFSQWWPAVFEVDGIRYATAEHWMMAAKARLFNDAAMVNKIIAAATPAETKELGRRIAGFNAGLWDEHKYELVVTGNLHKFSQHPELKHFLVSTTHDILVEASVTDRVWGIGMAGTDPDRMNPLLWKGENLLGFALMKVRDQLK